MSSYKSGMSLGGEIRESVSLDDDDLSDVEDEVFIRDGKRGKFSDDVGVKRPLMAPRRKITKPTFSPRIKTSHHCNKALWKPCCYVFAATSVLLGLIALAVLISLFPLPLNKFEKWLLEKIHKAKISDKNETKIFPCVDFKVSDVWKTTLPYVRGEAHLRTLDVNEDGIDDIIFGFATESEDGILRPDVFCDAFFKTKFRCEGGVLALDGRNGSEIWRTWTNDSIVDVVCTADVNGDGLFDCLVLGRQNAIGVLDSKTGKRIWYNDTEKCNLFLGNFVSDFNNDSIVDVLASCTDYSDNSGALLLISGKTGVIFKRVNVGKTFFTPQILNNNKILFGTGGPTKSGSLRVYDLGFLLSDGNQSFTTIYNDTHGMLNQATLIDITGDGKDDIIIATFSKTFIAFNGDTLEPIWNFTVDGESYIPAAPAYYNNDNISDFFIVYNRVNKTKPFTMGFIIDGKTGSNITKNYIPNIVNSQQGILTLSTEGFGMDSFIYWTNTNYEIADNDSQKGQNKSELVNRLFAMNQHTKLPGIEIFNSFDREKFEENETRTPVEVIIEYLKMHPNLFQFNEKAVNFGQLVKQSTRDETIKYNPDYDLTGNLDTSDVDYSYLDEAPYNSGNSYYRTTKTNSRDPRSQMEDNNIYDYKNVHKARKRLLNDLESTPIEILRETFEKNREYAEQANRFEQRDVNNVQKDEEDTKNMQVDFKNVSDNLWTLESENEEKEKASGYARTKRSEAQNNLLVDNIVSMGVLTNADNSSNSSYIDVVFVVNWYYPNPKEKSFDLYLDKCVKAKIESSKTNNLNQIKISIEEKAALFTRECQAEIKRHQNDFPDFDKVFQLHPGHMSVYRLRLECICLSTRSNERCAKFLPDMGKNGTGHYTVNIN